MPTVHVIDDDDSFRAAIARLLRVSGYEVRIYTSAGDFLINYSEDHAGPACILLDVGMPGPSGLELQTALAARGVLLPVVFLTGCGDIPMTVQAIKAGAIQFLTKPVDPELLLQVMAEATQRDAARRTAQKALRSIRARYEQLTERELQVLEQVLAGKLNKQIAGEIGVSERTVKSHRAQLLAKMNVSSVAELVRVTIDLGLTGASASGAPADRSPAPDGR